MSIYKMKYTYRESNFIENKNRKKLPINTQVSRARAFRRRHYPPCNPTRQLLSLSLLLRRLKTFYCYPQTTFPASNLSPLLFLRYRPHIHHERETHSLCDRFISLDYVYVYTQTLIRHTLTRGLINFDHIKLSHSHVEVREREKDPLMQLCIPIQLYI